MPLSPHNIADVLRFCIRIPVYIKHGRIRWRIVCLEKT